MKPIELIESTFSNVEWKDTGKEYDGWPSPELFIEGKATGLTRRRAQEMWDDLHCAADPYFMKALLGMDPAPFDPKQEFIAVIRNLHAR